MRKISRYVCTYFITAMLLIGCLLAAASIPRSAIEKNAIASAEFLAADPAVFHYQVEKAPASIRDQYADANLLNIAYYFDPEHPLKSIVWDYYYLGDDLTANESFLKAVKENPPADKEYLRYWHGSLTIVRPLLVFLSVNQIYILHAVILIVLFTALMYVLLKNKYRMEAAALSIALVMVNVWFVPLCLEYYWMFLVMFLSSILAVKLAVDEQYESLDYLFLITGIVAAFLDFLTVEIITVLIPLLLVLSIRRWKGEFDGAWKATFRWLLLWGIGFVGMWVMKWVLAAVYTGQSVAPYLKDNTMLHLGLKSHISKLELIQRGWLKNFFALAPFEYGIYGSIVLVLFILYFIVIPVWKNKIRVKGRIDWNCVRLYLLIGALPYVRYMLLPTHTSHHYFFMHRAQTITVMALCFVVREVIEKNTEKAA